jgi:3-oxoacyl-[acyl-carrier protein] reductase
MIDISGKTALVTGGSRGIGAATVEAMVRAGAHVIVHYGSNKDAALKVAEEAGRDQCHLVCTDLDQPGATAQLWRDSHAWRGQIDIVVNNAGIAVPADINGSDEDWQRVWQNTLQVNLIATADLCREAIKHWQASNRGGAIVNVASRASFRGDGPNYWAYAASKAGMVALTKTLARAYSGQGIYTYAVAPGFVATDMALAEAKRDPAMWERTLSEIPMGDIAPPSDIAHTICFLASGLVTHATGQTLDVNGASYVR